jgi:hypothetical protein
MIIHRSQRDGNFATIPNATLRDPRLSYAARGVLGEILSRPDDWHTTAADMARAARTQRADKGEGRRKLEAIFAELRDTGYLRYDRKTTPGKTVIHIYDAPQTGNTPGGTSGPPAETQEMPGQADMPHGWYAGGTGNTPGGTSGPPADTDISAGGTDIPPTDMSKTGMYSLRLDNEDLLSLHAGLSARVPGVTMDETRAVLESIANRGGIQSPMKYMLAVIANGQGSDLVSQIRRQAQAHRPGTGSSPPFRDTKCQRCQSTDHAEEDCPTRNPPPDPVPDPAHPTLVVAGEKCDYSLCVIRGPQPVGDDGLHDFCRDNLENRTSRKDHITPRRRSGPDVEFAAVLDQIQDRSEAAHGVSVPDWGHCA